jgi:hypothetical protein
MAEFLPMWGVWQWAKTRRQNAMTHRRPIMLSSKRLQSLLNGGATVLGAEGLEVEIDALVAEMGGHRRELGEMPSRRAQLILSDDHRAAIDKLEARERDLYRELEKGQLQLSALQSKLAERRYAEIQPRIDHYLSLVAEAQAKADASLIAALEATSAAFAVFESARHELGPNDANRLLPNPIHFAGILNEQCIAAWREHTDRENQRSARQQNMGHNISRIQMVRSIGPEAHQQYEPARRA